MRNLPQIAVCGCGNAGMAMAADLSMLGFKVNLCELPEFKDNLDPILKNGGISLTGKTYSGKTGLAKLNRITDNPEEAIEGVELIMINTPAMASKVFVEALSPFLAEGQTVIVNTGYWASLRSKEILMKTGALEKITFVEQNVNTYLSSKIEPSHAHIYNFKRDMGMSAWPASKNPAAYALVKKVYPQMRLCKNVLETNFYPGNPSVHAQINVPRAEFFFERAKQFRFYGEASMCASKLVDAFDRERIRVAKALDCDVCTYPEWLRKAYLYEGENIYEIFGNVSCEFVTRWANDAGNRRLLKEDLCYFFIPMEQLAEVVGIDVPVTKAIVEIIQIFTDFDYRANGITLKDLGMQDMDKKQIINYVTYGYV